jgi:hypothetical protein
MGVGQLLSRGYFKAFLENNYYRGETFTKDGFEYICDENFISKSEGNHYTESLIKKDGYFIFEVISGH